jgi:hypothetical protein
MDQHFAATNTDLAIDPRWWLLAGRAVGVLGHAEPTRADRCAVKGRRALPTPQETRLRCYFSQLNLTTVPPHNAVLD